MAKGPIKQSYALVVDGRRGRWLALVALAFLVSGLEALGAGLVFILIGMVTDPEAGFELPMIGDISGFLPDLGRTELLIGAATAVGAFFVIRGALLVIQTYAQYRITYNAGARLATTLVRGYLAMSYEYHLRRDSAVLVRNALVSVPEAVNRVVLPSTVFIAELLVVAGLVAVLLVTAPLASLLAIALLGPATYIVLRLVKARVRRYGHIANQAAHESLRTLQESLHGFRDVRLLGRERVFVQRFSGQRRRDARAKANKATFSQLTSVLIETLLILSIVIFVVATVSSTGTASESLAILGLFAYAGMRLKPSLQKVINAANQVRFATPAIDDLYHDLEEIKLAAESYTDRTQRAGPIPPLQKEIELRKVSFAYTGADSPALHDVGLTINAGESIGICGPTGGGKSTLADIIAGLLEPTSGTVLVDGVDIAMDPRGWHSQLGVVSQEPYLFDDTIERNVALGIPDKEIDDESVRRALQIAQIDEFVASLPKGVDSDIGEHGVLLSGGQRQRLAIARALYRDPKVLLLDEGTSALDNETEREFIAAIEALRGQKTLIIVAHRLSTIQRCDRVIYVNNGLVSGGGTYAELYDQNASFRQMAL